MVHALLAVIIVWGFGCWGIRKLLRENPKAGKAASDGAASLITRIFGRLF
jgi:hypothetical protein